MPYTVNKSSGEIIAIVNDFQKEIVAGLELAGYGYVNYGELTAENFVRLVENFSSKDPPQKPTRGQLWYNTKAALPVLCQYEAGEWVSLFSIDAANKRAGLFHNGTPAYPDVNATPGSLVVRGSDGLIPASSLPAVDNVGTAGRANQADKLTNVRTFGSRNGGLGFDGTQNVALTTSHIAEGDQLYYTEGRVRGALKGGRYIDINTTTGEVSFNGPDPTSGGDGAQGPAGPKGDKGDKGDPGAAGPAGEKGADGTAASVIVQSNYGVNGYVVFNGGYCIQWGQYRAYISDEFAYTLNYPIAFGGPALAINATAYVPNSSDAFNLWCQRCGLGSGTTFTIQMQSSTGDSNKAYGFDWVAHGTINPNQPPVETPPPAGGYTGTPFAALGFIPYGPASQGEEPLTPDKIGTSGDPTWYVWAPGTYQVSQALIMARRANIKAPVTNIVVPAGWKLEIYSGGNLTGSKLLEVVGPKWITKPSANGTRQTIGTYNYQDNWTRWDFSNENPMMAHFTPETRLDQAYSSSTLFPGWSGSFRISKTDETSTPTPTPTDPGDGGGGGGGCVWQGASMPNGLIARDAQAGDDLWILDSDGEGYHDGSITSIKFSYQPCYTIHTISGISLTASDTTPITMRDGSSINIAQCLGREVPVWDEEGFRWEEVTALNPVGDMRVALLNAGDNTYAAGNSPGRYIFTHNLTENKELN